MFSSVSTFDKVDATRYTIMLAAGTAILGSSNMCAAFVLNQGAEIVVRAAKRLLPKRVSL